MADADAEWMEPADEPLDLRWRYELTSGTLEHLRARPCLEIVFGDGGRRVADVRLCDEAAPWRGRSVLEPVLREADLRGFDGRTARGRRRPSVGTHSHPAGPVEIGDRGR